jgi:glycosyltransferase involved in cell wall biosynthesis
MTSGSAAQQKALPRLLLLSPFAPHLDGAMGGPVVIAGLVTALSAHARLALLYLRGQDEPRIDPCVSEVCEMAVEVARPRRGSGIGGVLPVLRGTPSWVAEWRVPEFATQLRRIIREWRPDIAQVEFHVMCQYARHLSEARVPVILTHHEPGAAAMADRRRAGLARGRFMPALEERAWRRYEQALHQHVNAVVTFTERDREMIRRTCPVARVEVIAPGVRMPPHALSPTGHGQPALLFFGNYLHAPNVDAALRLGRDIFPQVRCVLPDTELWLVGDRPPAEVQALAGGGVVVAGRVDDIGSCLDAAAAIIVPLRLGGGMRVKVMETLAAGKALIASRLAVAGLDVADGRQVLLAESDEEFAQAARWLLEHPDERAALGRRAREWAQANLSWEQTAQRYAALHEELVKRRTGSQEARS